MAMNPNHPGSLEDQLAELRLRVLRLEQLLRAQDFVVEKTEVTPAVGPAVPAGAPVVSAAAASETPLQVPYPAASFQRSVTPPLFGHREKAGQGDARSLESRIGSQWFNRVGILAML